MLTLDDFDFDLPGELIAQYQTQRAELNEKIDGILEKITAMLEETGHGKE